MQAKAKELAATDEFFKPFAEKTYRGNMNVTTIRTTMGRTIMLQHDATSPSPHNLIHGIYGTKGAALYDPQPPRLATGNHQWVSDAGIQSIRGEIHADDHASIERSGRPDESRSWRHRPAGRLAAD